MGSNNNGHEADDRLKALHTNMNAIKAVSAAIEGTLGPKGLDTMLVDANGHVIITNDGVTILNKMEVNHPAAKMLIQVARSQQQEIGDGTTTATLLSTELLVEAVNQVDKGVPIPKVIKGVREGIKLATTLISEHSRIVDANDRQLLQKIAYIAGREHSDIAELIVNAAQLIGNNKLLEQNFRFSDSIIAHEGSNNELISGLVISKTRMNSQMPNIIENAKILVVQDALEPEEIDDEALGTEAGFRKYLEFKEAFKASLNKLKELEINVIAVGRGIDPIVEEFCIDNRIMLIQRLSNEDLNRLIENTGAKTIKRTGLKKATSDLKGFIGLAGLVYEDEKLKKIRIIEGNGKPIATVLVGASTGEIVEERERIAKDAAASVQAAIKGGYVPGGGTIELFISKELEELKTTVKGLEVFGLQAVISMLRKPMAQIIQNAGFNQLEKLEEASLAQLESKADNLGINTDTGLIIDMEQAGVIDPTLVKLNAIKVAGEIAEAILRINTIIKMKKEDE